MAYQTGQGISDLVKKGILLIGLIVVLVAAVIVGQHLISNESFVQLIATFGYAGVFVAAIIAGVNVILPVPAAAFTPVFIEAGLTTPLIIISLAAGTLVADLIGYLIGHTSRELLAAKHPRVLVLTQKVSNKHPVIVVSFVALYAGFVPLPNELILIPLALGGVPWRWLVLPLFFGAIMIQTLLVTGVSALPILM